MWLMEYKERFLFFQLSYTNWTRQSYRFQECTFQIMVEIAIESMGAEKEKSKSLISSQF